MTGRRKGPFKRSSLFTSSKLFGPSIRGRSPIHSQCGRAIPSPQSTSIKDIRTLKILHRTVLREARVVTGWRFTINSIRLLCHPTTSCHVIQLLNFCYSLPSVKINFLRDLRFPNFWRIPSDHSNPEIHDDTKRKIPDSIMMPSHPHLWNHQGPAHGRSPLQQFYPATATRSFIDITWLSLFLHDRHEFLISGLVPSTLTSGVHGPTRSSSAENTGAESTNVFDGPHQQRAKTYMTLVHNTNPQHGQHQAEEWWCFVRCDATASYRQIDRH